MRKRILYTILSILILSCSKEEKVILRPEPSEPNEKYWSLNQSEKTVPSTETEITLKIESNLSWKVESNPDWVKIQPDSGIGNAEIKLIIEENPQTISREDIIVFKSEINQKNFKISQRSRRLKLISYSGKEGPIQLSEPIYFLFNKPIKVNFIKSGNEKYSFKIDPKDLEYFDNNHGVKFKKGASVLGNEYAYMISVQDEEDKILIETKDLQFYSQKFLIPGFLKDVILDDAKNFWVLSVQTYLQNEPSVIIKYKIENRLLIEEFRFEVGIDGTDNFSYVPGAFCINPYNDLIYVTNPLQNKIEVYNKTGGLVKEITKEGLTITDAIVFLKSGLGIFTGQLHNRGNWLYIDSSQNDKISLPIDNPNFNTSFKNFVLNYDQSKAYVLGNRSPIFKIFDDTGHFKEINMKDLYPTGADAVRITQNKLNNNIYVAGLYNQQIINPDFSFLSKQSYAKFFIGDFSYDPDQSNHIYALTGATGNSVRFKLLDYNNQATKMEHRINHNFSLGGYPGVITSPDNDLIILYTDRYDNTSKRSQIVVFDTEMFQ